MLDPSTRQEDTTRHATAPRQVVVVIAGVEDFGIRTLLVTQFRHAQPAGISFRYVAVEDGDCAGALRAAGASVVVGGGQIALGHPGHPLLLPFFWWRRLPHLRRAYAGIRRYLQSTPCEILYTQSYPGLVISRLAARGLDRRLVCHLHTNLNRTRLLGLQRVLVSLALAALADKLVAASDFVAGSLCGFARRKVCRVDNGIEVRAILDSVQGVAKDRRRIVIVGRLTGLKKQEIAIRAIQILRDRGIDCELELIGGPLAPSVRQYRVLRDLVRGLDLADRVRFMGVLSPPHRRVASALASVSCSTRESFGLAIVEAMVCGTAVVAAHAGAVTELIEDGRTGLLVRPDDPAALADALAELLRDPALGAALTAAARRRALERYDIACHLRALRGCFETVLGGGDGPPAAGS